MLVIGATAATIDLFVAMLCWAFARAPGWQHFRVFGFGALSAAAYSAVGLVFYQQGFSVDVLVASARLNTLNATLATTSWFLYSNIATGKPVTRFDRSLAGIALLLGVASQIPDLAFYPDHVRTAYSFGTLCTLPEATRFGTLTILFMVGLLAVPFVRFIHKASRRDSVAWAYVVAYAVYFATCIGEGLTVTGILRSPFLADVGYCALVLAVTVEMAHRVAVEAKRLTYLNQGLARQVEERTEEAVLAQQVLIQADRHSALGQLAAGIAHEINNPLAYVIGNLGYAMEQLKNAGGHRELVEVLSEAHDGGLRIRRIVADLSVYVRGDSETSNGAPLSAAEAALRIVGPQLKHHALASLVVVDSPLPRVDLSEGRLTQVLVNLLVNATHAFEDQGKPLGQSHVRIVLEKGQPGWVVVRVVDDGPGIRPDLLSRVCDPYFSTKKLGRGTGLGLFLCKGIVESVKGRLEILSTVGTGTTVSVYLPESCAPSLAPRMSSQPPPPSREIRVLVVDDERLIGNALRRQLQPANVRVVTGGEDALHALEFDAFDAILCDLMMPGITGIDIFRRVTAKAPTLAKKFIFLTGGAVNDESRSFLRQSGIAWLSKPADTKDLWKAIHRVVAEAQAAL